MFMFSVVQSISFSLVSKKRFEVSFVEKNVINKFYSLNKLGETQMIFTKYHWRRKLVLGNLG